MEQNKLLNILKHKFGLCPSGVKIFENSKEDINRLATACVKWVELFIEHEHASQLFKSLSLEELKVFNNQGIYYNQDIDINDNNNDTIILLGNCNVNIKMNDFLIARIYVLNNSILSIESNDNAVAYIDLYHNGKINANKQGYSKLKIDCFNKLTSVIGNAEIIQKNYVKGEIFNYKY